MNKVKRLLVGMLILGAITAATAGGTFATFNAATSNSATVSTGTLLLGNTANAGVECMSTSASGAPPTATITAGNSNACSALFSANVNPTGTAQGNLTLRNEGNFNAASSTLTATACTSVIKPVTVNGTAFSGDVVATPICNFLQLVVAEVTVSGGTTLTGTGCILGAAGGAIPVTNCQFGPLMNTLPASTALGAFNQATNRFFVVAVKFPDTADNRYQGQMAQVTLTWTINQ